MAAPRDQAARVLRSGPPEPEGAPIEQTSAALAEVVRSAPTKLDATVALSPSANPVTEGQPVTFTASVSGNGAAPGGVSARLQRPVEANWAASSATLAALASRVPLPFSHRSHRVPPSSRVK